MPSTSSGEAATKGLFNWCIRFREDHDFPKHWKPTCPEDFAFCNLGQAGVPPVQEMVLRWGSVDAWQKQAVDRCVALMKVTDPVDQPHRSPRSAETG